MPVQGHPSRKSDQFKVRLPDGSRNSIKDEARKEQISMNSFLANFIEIAMRLQGGAGLAHPKSEKADGRDITAAILSQQRMIHNLSCKVSS